MKPVPQWKKRLIEESGSVLILTAICMTALMGFAALAVDVGLLFRAKRYIQMAADAAATAGALDYYNTSSSAGVKTAAAASATANGFTDGSGGVTVTVNNPATSGSHTGPGTVEVIITQPNPTFFMRVFGRDSMTVGARAVAGQVAGQACIFLMASGTGLSIQGKSTIQGIDPVTGNIIPACGAYVNGNVAVKGSSNNMDMAFIEAAGGLSGNHDTNPAPVITGAPSQTIPQSLMITPPAPSSYGSCNPPAGSTSSTSKGITTYTATLSGTLAPGCYGVGGAAKTILNVSLSGATLGSGLYTFDMGTASGGGTLTVGNNVTGGNAAQGSAGVTLNVYTGNFSVTSTTNANLYAPSDGASDPYNGVLLLEPSSNTGTINIQWGSADGKFAGIIDAPGANATLQDNGGSALVTGLILGSLTMGTGTLNVVNYNSVYSSGPFQTIRLVE